MRIEFLRWVIVGITLYVLFKFVFPALGVALQAITAIAGVFIHAVGQVTNM